MVMDNEGTTDVLVCQTCQEAAEMGVGCSEHQPCCSVVGFWLVGKVVRYVFVAPGEETLWFVLVGGEVVCWSTEGGCCSETWFSDITGFEALIGSPILSVRNLELSVDDGRCRQDYDTFYGVEFVTHKGRCHVAYRNSSNGYYGGDSSMEVVQTLPENLKEIVDDWSA